MAQATQQAIDSLGNIHIMCNNAVVNTASLAGYFGMHGNAPYAAAKFGVVGISETMRLDLRRKGINVSVLSPGVVDTAIFQSDRNRPDELGREQDAGFSAPDFTERLKRVDVLQPSVIGDMVLHAIRHNIFYIVSQRDFQPGIDARHREITAAFDLWEEFLEGAAA